MSTSQTDSESTGTIDSLAGDTLQGKVCLVTGATSGIGRETVLGLARRGATVVAVARDPARGEAAVALVKERTGNANVELLLADLSSQRSIRQLAGAFQAHHNRLDVLVNNAGIVQGKWSLTDARAISLT